MNKKLILTIGYLSSGLAVLTGIITAIGADSPNTVARASTVAVILGVFGVTSFMFGLVSKE